MVASPAVFDTGSYRDPDTRVFHHQNGVYRCLSDRALDDWSRLRSTAFFSRFVEAGRLVDTERVADVSALPTLESRWAAAVPDPGHACEPGDPESTIVDGADAPHHALGPKLGHFRCEPGGGALQPG